MNRDHLEQENAKGNQQDAYREEMRNEGSTFTDTPRETEARDAAKVEKARTGWSQKMDGGNPEEMDDAADDEIAEQIRRETLEKK